MCCVTLIRQSGWLICRKQDTLRLLLFFLFSFWSWRILPIEYRWSNEPFYLLLLFIHLCSFKLVVLTHLKIMIALIIQSVFKTLLIFSPVAHKQTFALLSLLVHFELNLPWFNIVWNSQNFFFFAFAFSTSLFCNVTISEIWPQQYVCN